MARYQHLWAKIRDARDASGKKQREIAETLGVKRSLVARWESEKFFIEPSPKDLKALAALTPDPFHYICWFADDQVPPHLKVEYSDWGGRTVSPYRTREEIAQYHLNPEAHLKRKVEPYLQKMINQENFEELRDHFERLPLKEDFNADPHREEGVQDEGRNVQGALSTVNTRKRETKGPLSQIKESPKGTTLGALARYGSVPQTEGPLSQIKESPKNTTLGALTGYGHSEKNGDVKLFTFADVAIEKGEPNPSYILKRRQIEDVADSVRAVEDESEKTKKNFLAQRQEEELFYAAVKYRLVSRHKISEATTCFDKVIKAGTFRLHADYFDGNVLIEFLTFSPDQPLRFYGTRFVGALGNLITIERAQRKTYKKLILMHCRQEDLKSAPIRDYFLREIDSLDIFGVALAIAAGHEEMADVIADWSKQSAQEK